MAAIHWIAATVVGVALSLAAAGAAERLPGPYPAEVERVVDGDTLGVTVAIWLNQDLSVLVRIRGIDAPELRGGCAGEREMAQEARRALEHLVGSGAIVLREVDGDKYFGRVVADVATPAGEDIGAALVADGQARRYDGGARRSWCEPGATGSVPGAAD